MLFSSDYIPTLHLSFCFETHQTEYSATSIKSSQYHYPTFKNGTISLGLVMQLQILAEVLELYL